MTWTEWKGGECPAILVGLAITVGFVAALAAFMAVTWVAYSLVGPWIFPVIIASPLIAVTWWIATEIVKERRADKAYRAARDYARKEG
ncbi:hypothetical protein [Phenylobacterium sp.]|uniref:hypothetical protein n=1 Tax=Phenylobacterium sp. TaxID=1871053 RepID=UPI0026196819|nr:hypothetical protein [Phenylobacterium sp.]